MGISRWTRTFGLDTKAFKRACRGLPHYVRNRRKFIEGRRASEGDGLGAITSRPCLFDRFDSGGVASGHYFHQDLLVAQLIHQRQPETHIDVGSRIDGFVAHLATFRKVKVLDIRPVVSKVPNIEFFQHDIMVDQERWHASTDSLSCLHALEHFGLGRYGDPVDYSGHLTGFRNLCRMLKPKARFYFAVPISAKARIEFDAHRVFSLDYLKRVFDEHSLTLECFHFVDDKGDLHMNVTPAAASPPLETLRYGCGIFELVAPDVLTDAAETV